MHVTPGASQTHDATLTADVVVVGSGPAGAAVARTLAAAGARVLVLEEGPYLLPADFPEDGFSAMARLYRGMGTTLTAGRAPIPYLQGRAVGGTSVINGAISWRLPRDVHEAWLRDDPPLGEALPWERVSAALDQVESDLSIAPTSPEIAGPHNLLLGKGAEALGLEHRPISRNVRGCRGLGRCLQGCPEGRKASMDRTYLPDAAARGAEIWSGVTVTHVLHDGAHAGGVLARTAGGARLRVQASRAVVLAASAVQTPLLLRGSGLTHGPVGERFQCHPGVSMAGRFPEPVTLWEGATQGHEVIGLRHQGIKLEALGYDMALAAGRLKSVGPDLSRDIADLAHWANWGAAIRARTHGEVGRTFLGGTRVRFAMGEDDMRLVRRGVRVLGEVMLAAGAEFVTPGVHGFPERVTDRAVMARFEEDGPLDPRAYAMAVTHMFGTAKMGSNPRTSVVRPDFRHHLVDRLYVADSSVFPTSLGVNPQTSILALATICGQGIA
jgi:choline dehydrogenase-like flavoprotein